ncbi:MAG: hypothetical protein AB7E47_04840 [Desulfovibrionaceae bacterium]
MPIGADYLTHKELARLIGVSETTIKNYRRKFAAYLPIKAHGKPIKLMPQAADVCARIHRCFMQGLSVPETRDRLAERYPNAAPPRKRTAKADPDALHALAHDLDTLIQAQTRTAERLDALCDLLATATARHDAADADLAETLRDMLAALAALAAAPPVENAPAPTGHGASAAPPNAPHDTPPDAAPHARVRRVTVRNTFGDVSEYLLETADQTTTDAPPTAQQPLPRPDAPAEPAASSQAAPSPDAFARPQPDASLPPPADIRDLPLAIRAEDDAFLGVAGKGFGHFSLTDLQALITDSFPPPAHFLFTWERDNDGIRFTARQPQAATPQRYDLRLSRTITPRGNTVAVVRELLVDARPMPTAALHTFIRQMRALRDEPPAQPGA